jgi:cell wall-associated NlpC family hydrolase
MSRAVFLRGLIGKPYARGSHGPEAFDCYGVVDCVWRQLFNRSLPVREEAMLARPTDWRRLKAPQDGALVFMRFAGDRHVGVYLADDGGGVLHAVEPDGWRPGDRRPAVVFDTLFALRLRGYMQTRFYLPR